MALKRQITARIKELLRQNPQGLNITEIVKNIDINRNTAGRYLENLMVAGQVEMHHFGMAKIYRLARRVPLSAMLSISSELIMLLDSGLRVMYANEPLLQFLDATQKDLSGKNLEYTPCVTIFDDAFDLLKKQVRNGLAGKEWSGELSLTKAGVVFSCRVAPAVFEEGQRGVSVLLEDITGRKHAERALRESETTARALINAPTDSILLLDPNGIILAVNETAALRMGRRQDELIGALVDNILPEEIAKARRSIISQVLEKKSAVRFEDERNGIWFDTVAYPTIDEDGEVTRIAVIARDITDRKRIEAALRESEGKLHAMLQSITDPMSMMDEDLNIIWVNETAKQYFGKDIVGRKCYEAFHQRRTPCEPYPCLAFKAFRDGKMHKHETAVIDAHGQTRLFECTTNVALRDKGGKPVAVLEISRDITDRKQAEEAPYEHR
jgi:PAS domain S-box-containing protein